jgi:hypothetical protein
MKTRANARFFLRDQLEVPPELLGHVQLDEAPSPGSV